MDNKGKWYKGIIVEEVTDNKTKQVSKWVHFFHFDSKWDEWYGNDNIEKLAPYLTHCSEIEEMFYTIDVYHTNEMKGGAYIGTPFKVTLLSEIDWPEAKNQIEQEVKRFMKDPNGPMNFKVSFIETKNKLCLFCQVLMKHQNKKY